MPYRVRAFFNGLLTKKTKEPSLETALDTDAVESWLRADVTWPAGVAMRGLRVRRLWPSKHGVITFELAVDLHVSGEDTTYVIQGGALGRIKCSSPSADAVLDSGWIMNLSLSSAELGVCVLSPDRDPRLALTQTGINGFVLPELLHGTKAADFLGLADDARDLRQKLVAYRIAKRCVFRLKNRVRSNTRSAFLKSFRRMPTDELLENYQSLGAYLRDRSGGTIIAPALLDHLPDARVLIFEGADASARHLTTQAADLDLAANVLALVHGSNMACSRSHGSEDELNIAQRWLPMLADSHPEHHERLLALVQHLTHLHERMPSRACCLLHRDFYSAQVLRQDDRTWVVDLDTMSMGHPEVDLATFSAHLLLDAIVDGSTDDAARALVHSFLESYRNHGRRPSADHLHFYLSSATARLAAIHATRGLDRQCVARLWTLAETTSSWS